LRPRVELTPRETATAVDVARRRLEENRALGRRKRRGGGGGPGEHSQGALGEAAVAKYMGLWNEWLRTAVGNIHARDVGKFDVRTTSPRLSLILHEDDQPDTPYILVYDRRPVFELVGWNYPRTVRRPEFWQTRTGRPCYFVPPKALRDVDELADLYGIGRCPF
jgi:hypothetical protein